MNKYAVHIAPIVIKSCLSSSENMSKQLLEKLERYEQDAYSGGYGADQLKALRNGLTNSTTNKVYIFMCVRRIHSQICKESFRKREHRITSRRERYYAYAIGYKMFQKGLI